MFKWNSILDQIRAESESARPKRDRMGLAYYYQSLLDSGEVSTRAELARFLGVSRARQDGVRDLRAGVAVVALWRETKTNMKRRNGVLSN